MLNGCLKPHGISILLLAKLVHPFLRQRIGGNAVFGPNQRIGKLKIWKHGFIFCGEEGDYFMDLLL